jgi:hypothetical protein
MLAKAIDKLILESIASTRGNNNSNSIAILLLESLTYSNIFAIKFVEAVKYE